MTDGQRKYTRTIEEFPGLTDTNDLAAIVDAFKPSVLIGTSTQPGAFDEQVVRNMVKHVERPLLCPIFNPTELAEAKAADVIRWSEGKAFVITGTPSAPVEYEGVTYRIGQGDNALMYPGICFDAIVGKARLVSDRKLLGAIERHTVDFGAVAVVESSSSFGTARTFRIASFPFGLAYAKSGAAATALAGRMTFDLSDAALSRGMRFRHPVRRFRAFEGGGRVHPRAHRPDGHHRSRRRGHDEVDHRVRHRRREGRSYRVHAGDGRAPAHLRRLRVRRHAVPSRRSRSKARCRCLPRSHRTTAACIRRARPSRGRA